MTCLDLPWLRTSSTVAGLLLGFASPLQADPLDVSLGGTLTVRPGEGYGYQAMVGITVGWEQLLFRRQGPNLGTPSTLAEPVENEGASDPAEQPLTDPEVPPERPAKRKRSLAVRPAWLQPAFAVELVRAVAQADAEEGSTLGSLATRARTSAVLPILRLRAGRGADETLRYSPTIDDPDRWLQSGGAEFRYEAQATWTLGRLVFAADEVAIARLRQQRDRERKERMALALKLLFRWQAARLAAADPEQDEAERAEAELEAVQAEIELDVLSQGWFSRRVGAGAGG